MDTDNIYRKWEKLACCMLIVKVFGLAKKSLKPAVT